MCSGWRNLGEASAKIDIQGFQKIYPRDLVLLTGGSLLQGSLVTAVFLIKHVHVSTHKRH